MPRATRPLARIHIDLAGGGMTLGSKDDNPPSREGTRYFMLITDDATRFRWVYFLKTKAEAPTRLQKWIEFIKNLGFRPPAYIRSDVGGEFRSSEGQRLLQEQGIIWEPTAPYSPEQNGVSERGIRTIMARTRAMLLDANLPKKLWADALEAAVAITNHLPTRTPLYNSQEPNGTTLDPNIKPSPHNIPFSAWFNAPPDILPYRKFGSKAYVHLHGNAKPIDKLSPRSKAYILIGYVGKSIYRLWDPETEKVISSKDVIIKEEFKQPAEFSRPEQPTETTIQGGDSVINHKFPNSDSMDELPLDEGTWLRPAKAFTAVQKFPEIFDHIPRTYHQAIRTSKAKEWKASMTREIEDLERRNTWKLIPRSDVPKDEPIAPGRWIYVEKNKPTDPNADDDGILRKSRWVICGNRLNKSSKDETYAPVVNPTTNRILFAAAAQFGWKIRQADVVLAYLHGRLKKTVYMRQPTGFEKGEPGTLVCAVEGSLYGLDPAAKIWYDLLTSLLRELGFRSSPYDPALWISTTRNHLYMTLYVDDLKILAANQVDADWIINSLKSKLQLKDLDLMSQYLGMEVTQNEGSIKLTQRRHIMKLLEEFHMENAHPALTPIDPGLIINDQPKPDAGFTKEEYQSGVGSIQYLATQTRPDIARAASLLGQFSSDPTPQCWKALLHVLRYLKGTMDRGVTYTKSDRDFIPYGYSDSDWAGPLNGNRRSTSGYVFCLANGPISWRSAKQTCVATSSNEAEYIAVSEAAKEAVWIRNMLIDLKLMNHVPIKIYMDNHGAIDLTKINALTKRSKHIDVRFHYTREQITNRTIEIDPVPSDQMAADGLTKPLQHAKFKVFLDLIGIE
ncbi:hypothetical protein VTO42DRAFT_8230 [Malbranchea cinnamomea]